MRAASRVPEGLPLEFHGVKGGVLEGLYRVLVGRGVRRFGVIVNPRKLEHGFRTISAGISYTLP